jgi:hypothetical protein
MNLLMLSINILMLSINIRVNKFSYLIVRFYYLFTQIDNSSNIQNPVGRPTIFIYYIASRIRDRYFNKLSKIGVPFRKKDLTELVTDFVKTEEMKNNFKNNVPGRDWINGFFNR